MSHQATKYGSTGGYETSTSKSSTLYGEGLLEDEETLVTSNSDSDDPPFEPRKKSAAKKGSVWSKVFIALVVISFFYFLNQKYEFLKPHNDINKNEKSDSSTVAPDTATKPVPAPIVPEPVVPEPVVPEPVVPEPVVPAPAVLPPVVPEPVVPSTPKEEIIAVPREVPFPKIHRSEYGAPAEGTVNFHLFDDSFLTEEKKLKVPMPTGAFWSNLVVRPTSDRGLSYPSMVYPYGFNWSLTMMQISYPPLRRLYDPLSIRDILNSDMAYTSVEQIVSRKIMSFDPLSVTIRFNSYNSMQYWESYLVQGSPYITTKYSATTPILTPLSIFHKFICARDASGNLNMNAPQIEGADRFGTCEVVYLPKVRFI